MFLDRSQHPTYTEVLTRLERKYKNLCLACKWHGTSQQDSVLTAGSSKNERGENPFRQPTDKDKISDNPLRHQRVIHGKKMFFCLKCIRRGTTEKGRWNTSHHTDGHLPWGQRKPRDNGGDSTTPSANTAQEEVPAPTATRKVSFKDALSGAAANASA